MTGIAFPIEDRDLNPSEVGLKSRTPHDRRDASLLASKLEDGVGGLPDGLIRRFHRSADLFLLDVTIDAAFDAFSHFVRVIEIFLQVVSEFEIAVADVIKPAVEPHALQRQLPQVDLAPSVAAGDIVVRLGSNGVFLGMFIDR